jgi:dTDP-4-amino-4,6-dideoxygalactose transaminase
VGLLASALFVVRFRVSSFEVAYVVCRTPLFPQKLLVGCPNLGDRERLLDRCRDILERRWLTNNGEFVQAFERQIADYLGVRHCIAVANATIGLQMAARALDLAGEVIVPSFTFPATAHALAWVGITPVFCDVELATHNIDPTKIESLIGPRTTGILAVHLWGNPCAVDSLRKIADCHRLKLFFDAAHAFGCSRDGRMVGNFGDAEVFSFHATKFVNSAEGGAITSNDDELADRLRRMRNFGFDQEQVVEVGTNAKMCEFAAAVGLTSLECREQFLECNRENYAAYQRVLAGAEGFELLAFDDSQQHNRQYIVVDVDARVVGVTRDEVLSALHAENVMAKRYFFPGCHRLEPFQRLAGSVRQSLSNTERLCEQLIQLPTGTAVDEAKIEQIGELLKSLSARARRAA